MTPELDTKLRARTLGPMESAVMTWAEAERRSVISIDDVGREFDWDRPAIRNVLFRLAHKGWLRRTANGRYETVLAETAGFAPPNPWAALATWIPEHYVALQSAAYEHDLTPDRPGDVQVAVAFGTRRPTAWAEIPIELIRLRTFSLAGTEDHTVHGLVVQLASREKVLSDSTLLQDRVGGIRGLARIVSRAADAVAWKEVIALTAAHPNGNPALRRLAALLTALGMPVPKPLEKSASSDVGIRPIRLSTNPFDEDGGEAVQPWNVVMNVDADDLREELRR